MAISPRKLRGCFVVIADAGNAEEPRARELQHEGRALGERPRA